MNRMRTRKAIGPDDILVEALRCLEELTVNFVTRLFNKILEGERMLVEWRRSVLVPIFKNKGDVQSCSTPHSCYIVLIHILHNLDILLRHL